MALDEPAGVLTVDPNTGNALIGSGIPSGGPTTFWVINPTTQKVIGKYEDDHPDVYGYSSIALNYDDYVYLQTVRHEGMVDLTAGFRILNYKDPTHPVSAGFSDVIANQSTGSMSQILEGKYFYFGGVPIGPTLQVFRVNC